MEKTKKWLTDNGFYKVAEGGYSLISDIFYNPVTRESHMINVRDYDYSDCSRDIDELYYMDIDEEVRKVYLHVEMDAILVGDTVKVIKGRKLPIGTTGIVREIKPYYDKYHRWVCDYVYFENGQRTNIGNCKRI